MIRLNLDRSMNKASVESHLIHNDQPEFEDRQTESQISI